MSKQLRKHLAVDEEVGVLVLDENDVTLCCYLRGALAGTPRNDEVCVHHHSYYKGAGSDKFSLRLVTLPGIEGTCFPFCSNRDLSR
jgi:hypothetical protein